MNLGGSSYELFENSHFSEFCFGSRARVERV